MSVNKPIVYGPVKDWGRPLLLLAGQCQYQLEEVTNWKILAKLDESSIENILHQAAERAGSIADINQLELELRSEEGKPERITIQQPAEGNREEIERLGELINSGIIVQESEEHKDALCEEGQMEDGSGSFKSITMGQENVLLKT